MKSVGRKLSFRGSVLVFLVASCLAVAFEMLGLFFQKVSFVTNDLLVPLCVGVAGSAIYFFFFSDWLERELREDAGKDQRRLVFSVANRLKPDFVPTRHFGISNESDYDFATHIRDDLKRSEFFYFSGFSARVSLVRLYECETGAVGTALLKLPLSEKSLNLAVKLFGKLTANRGAHLEGPQKQTELFGFEGDRDEIYKLARSSEIDDHRKYITELVTDSVIFAYHVARQKTKTIILRDWDDATEYRIEMMSCAVYLGNYHPDAHESEFSKGTCRFDDKAYILRLLQPSIKAQLSRSIDPEIRCVEQETSLSDVLNAGIKIRGLLHRSYIHQGRVQERFEDYRQVLNKHSQR